MNDTDTVKCIMTATNNCIFIQSYNLHLTEVVGYPNSGNAEKLLRIYTKFFEDDTLKKFDPVIPYSQGKIGDIHHFYIQVDIPIKFFEPITKKDRYGRVQTETPIITFMHQILYPLGEIRKVEKETDLKLDVRRYICMNNLPRAMIAFFHAICKKQLTEFGKHMFDLLVKFDKIFLDDKKNKKKLAMETFVRAILGFNYYKTNVKRSEKIRTAVRKWYRNTHSYHRAKEGLSDEILQRLVENNILTDEDVTTVKSELIFLKL